MIDSRFVFLAVALSVLGTGTYVVHTWRGTTAPNRVTWSLWALEGLLTFAVEVQQHVGVASAMTFALGFIPLVVLLASFHNAQSAWRIGPFDVACGLVSLVGLVAWIFIRQPTVALVAFVAADQVAALPTIRKAWLSPQSETAIAFFMGTFNCGITLLTLHHFTSAGVLFPGCIMITDLIIATLVATRLGDRVRSATPQRVRA